MGVNICQRFNIEVPRFYSDIIARTGAHSGKLTYRSAAKMMVKTEHEKHSRAVAQMCDLLDAAACLAGVPLLALVAVRAKDGEINPKAWTKEYNMARDAIIHRSLSYRFSRTDFEAIAQALSDLKGLGNRKAWAFVHRTYGDLLYRRLTGDYTGPLYGALDDLGTEILPGSYTPDTRTYVTSRFAPPCCSELWAGANTAEKRDSLKRTAADILRRIT